MDRSRQERLLLQLGIALFLCAVLAGLAVQHFRAPRLALSAHLIGLFQGLFLLVLGLVWSRLRLGRSQSRLAFWLLAYQGVVAFLSNLLAAVWAAGGSIVPMAAGGARGSMPQEVIINIGLRTSGAALIAGLLLVAWGLRGAGAAGSG